MIGNTSILSIANMLLSYQIILPKLNVRLYSRCSAQDVRALSATPRRRAMREEVAVVVVFSACAICMILNL